MGIIGFKMLYFLFQGPGRRFKNEGLSGCVSMLNYCGI